MTSQKPNQQFQLSRNLQWFALLVLITLIVYVLVRIWPSAEPNQPSADIDSQIEPQTQTPANKPSRAEASPPPDILEPQIQAPADKPDKAEASPPLGTLIETQEQPPAPNQTDKLGQLDYVLGVVDNSQTRQKGLSGRSNLLPRHGLLFVFQTLGKYGIWMKDMNFAIDIIWLNDNQRIVGLAANIQPDSYPEVFRPQTDSLYVLEINAGEAALAGLEIGDYINLTQWLRKEAV